MNSIAGESGVKIVGEGLRREDPELPGLGGRLGERYVGDGGASCWGEASGRCSSDVRGDEFGEGLGEGSYIGGGTNDAFFVIGLPGVLPESRAA